VQVHVDASKARQSMLRACMDLGRLEMKAQDFGAAKAVLFGALEVAKDKEGADSEATGARGCLPASGLPACVCGSPSLCDSCVASVGLAQGRAQ
jgi:hypothetical protein